MKRWYQSRTMWALFVSAMAHALVLAGVAEAEAEQAAANLVAAIVPMIGLLADAIGVYGRRNASGPLA